MKFLVDSCVSRFAVQALRGAGFDTLWIPELGEDPGDEAIMRRAFEGGMIPVTADAQTLIGLKIRVERRIYE